MSKVVRPDARLVTARSVYTPELGFLRGLGTCVCPSKNMPRLYRGQTDRTRTGGGRHAATWAKNSTRIIQEHLYYGIRCVPSLDPTDRLVHAGHALTNPANEPAALYSSEEYFTIYFPTFFSLTKTEVNAKNQLWGRYLSDRHR
ncbi:hypothetical protein FKM82_027971 [Ascaphus truei]